MTEPTPPMERPDGSVCPWCSAAVTPETVTCPSCGAVLISDDEPNVPGVTAVDLKVMLGEKPTQRNRLLSWISGEYPEEVPAEPNAQAIAPPDPEVQREIRRLEFEAEVANLQAEADALLSEAVAEGRVIDVPEGTRPLAVGDEGADAAEDASTSDERADVAGDGPPSDESADAAEDAAATTDQDAPPA